MVLRAGLALVAVGLGGFFLIQSGVPPIYVGAALLALVVLGAIVGPDSSSSGGSGGGGSGGGSKAANAMNAANGFLDALGNNGGGDDRRTEPSGPGGGPEDDDTTSGPGRDTGDDITVQINNLVQNINVANIEQNIEQIVTNIDITDEEHNYVEQFISILEMINEGDFRVEGDVVVISAFKDIKIHHQKLMVFLNILTTIKYQELRQLIIGLIDLPEDTPWEVKIEQLIVIYRESGGERENENRWEVFIRNIEDSNLPNAMKESFIKIARLDKNALSNNISPESLVLFRRVVMQIPVDRVGYSTKQMTQYLGNNGYSILNNTALIDATEYLRDHEPAVKNYKNAESYSGNMSAKLGGLEQSVKELISEMEDELQMDQRVIEEDKEILDDLGDALQKIDKWGPVISDLRSVDLPTNQHQSPEGFFHDMQAVVQAHEELQSQTASQNLLDDMKRAKQDLEEAVEDLKDKEGSQEREVQQEIEIAKQLSKIEDAYLGAVNDGLDALKSYKNQG